MDPQPDFGYTSYNGTGKLQGKVAIITGTHLHPPSLSSPFFSGGDSGIGRAVALAFAREGASIVISYLNETEDAQFIQHIIEREGQQCLLIVSYSISIDILSLLLFSLVTSQKKHNARRSSKRQW